MRVPACAAKFLREGCDLAKHLLYSSIERLRLEEIAFQQLGNMPKVVREGDIADVLM